MSGGLHGQVVDVLGHEISAGVHPPGSVLRIDGLEERFGISRSVAREVVRTLASIRLVVSRKRVGVVVRPRAEWNTFDPALIRWLLAVDRSAQVRTLAELRTAVEPVAAAAAARNAGHEQAARLVALAERMVATARAGDLETFLEADVAFHGLVLAASGNEMFAQLEDVFGEVLRWRTGRGLMPEHPKPVALRLHCEIAECVRGGDPARAEAAMRELVEEAFEGTLESLDAERRATGTAQ
ncbi:MULTISPECIES: FadR/GntR family transcriptional regulator [Saccharopolyspora]|uniref:FCD domain-containing protein n=1 Tax=Saccharopolyspora gregorii TaxID=33914 RepID=A0ABP6RN70_9PSEU|nr:MULTISPECIES: FCD domain-containing protein [Saccharopolyspora]MCA1189296.1 FCD domain-containing protein [Saccharopolyspora sp. 6T]MCA1195313.1 FCD domain-containing protein [Saccharopolyspora sp. 6V]MCA1229276.1 FCD domain-containing protein [Saccharopolyspora sp. 6M]MCA1280358.1 FCD domain-containing protein [Saccharopolyspora sp. 7B]